MPAQPSYFLKPRETLNGHLRALRRPAGARFLNYEGELAVIVGRRMHGVAQRDVLDHVYGFAPANDVGLHDFRHADRGSMLRVKGQDGFLPIGPAVLTADEWRPDDGFTLRTRLNGEIVQEADEHDVIWDYRYLLADITPAGHARARRRRAHRHAGQLAADGARRRRRGRDLRDAGAAQPRRGVGRRPERPGRAAGGLGEHAARRARDARGGGRAPRCGRRARVRAPPRMVLVLSECWTMTPPRDLRALVRIAQEAEDGRGRRGDAERAHRARRGRRRTRA